MVDEHRPSELAALRHELQLARQFRQRLAEATLLPPDTPPEEVLAEVKKRFKGLVRAMPGHGLDHGIIGGDRTCECGLPVGTNMRIWFDHQTELRRAQENLTIQEE